MKKTYDETGRPVNKDPLFLQFLRYAAVIVVSVCLLALSICSIAAKDDVWLICFIFIAFMAFYITIPIIALWIYSFVLAIHYAIHKDRQNPIVFPYSRYPIVGYICLCVKPSLSKMRRFYYG